MQNVLQSQDAIVTCIKKQCSNAAYRLAEEKLDEYVREQLQKLSQQLQTKKIDTNTYIKTSTEIWKQKNKAMKMDKDILMYYECGLTKCSKEAERFRKAFSEAVSKDIGASMEFIRANKNDKTKAMLLDFHKYTLAKNKKRMKLLQKPFTTTTYIDILQTY